MKLVANCCFIAFGIAALSAAAPAQTESPRFDYLAVEVGVFFPSDGLLRDRFGENIVRFGIGPVYNRKLSTWRPTWDIGFIGDSEDGNRFMAVPVTIGLQRSFGNLEEAMVPYVRGAVGLAYLDFDIDADNGSGFVPAGMVELGLMGGDRLKLSLRYTLMGEKSGINFSGTTLALSYGLIRI